MSGFLPKSALFLLLLPVAYLGWTPGIAFGVEDQHFGASCGTCHTGSADITPANARLLTGPPEQVCGRCHQGAVEASHPTGFTPDRPLPDVFPLDPRGQLSCSTCHDLHNGEPGRLRSASNNGDFCQSCHDSGFFGRMADRGASLRRSGHLDARSQRFSHEFDAYSERCAECHRDKATRTGSPAMAAFTASNGTGMVNHPIGADYTSASRRLKLNPENMLPREMLLPGGKVGCVSCHQAYSKDHGAPVGPTTCFDCHNL